MNITMNAARIVWDEIAKAKRILMHCHPNPDGDSLGSTLGLSHALKNAGKDVTVIKGDSEKPTYLSKLPGFSEIVEKNIFETDLTQFDLFLILDSGSLDQISKLGTITFPSTLKTITIDHHASNTGYADINLIDTTYPATCQIVADLLQMWNLEITSDIALCLFIGIFTDTGGFRFRATTSKTFETAALLTQKAPNFTDFIFEMDNNNSKGRLILEGLLLTSIKTYCDDSIAIASVSYNTLQDHHITDQDAIGVHTSNQLKSVIGWNVGITLIETKQNFVKVSMRTRDMNIYNVAKLAVELGGGGHIAAAGATITGNLQEVEQKVVEAAKKVYSL